MKVAVFGATGLVGGGVLLTALDSPHVDSVVSIGRREIPHQHPKLRQVEHGDFEHFGPIADDLTGVDACFWCLGISAAGLDERQYTRITHDFTLEAAKVLLERSPEVCFCFVSGSGTDEGSRMMWARVKGKTESDLAALGLSRVAMFRPAFIRQTRGFKKRGALFYVFQPLIVLLYWLARAFGGATTNVEIGRAMIAVARGASDERILTSADINRVAKLA